MKEEEKAGFWSKLKNELRLLEAQKEDLLEDEERIPCVDQSCIGSLGPDGRCRVCGLERGDILAQDEGERSGDIQASEDEEDELLDFSDRIPCSDESCVGTIGEDGCCRICGLKASH